jgi:hypothetical protein
MTTYQQGIMLSNSIDDMEQQKTSGSTSTVVWEQDRAITCDSPTEVMVQARPLVVILFFFSAVGCTMGWTAILSSLVYYSAALGMDSYLFLNLGVFVPLCPISLAQARWDLYFDQRYQSLRSFSFRGIVGFSVTVVAIMLAPVASNGIVPLSFLSTVMGTASAVLHGMLKQMASFIYPNCSRLQAAVTSGMQASSIFVLLVSLTTQFGSSGASDNIVAFYVSIAVLTTLCWGCFHLLMSRCEDVSISMLRRDSSFYTMLNEPMLDDDDDDDDNSVEDASSSNAEMSYRLLWRISWPCCISIMMTVASSMSVASWFNRVKSADASVQTLPQILFYTRLFADFLGRPATLLVKPCSGHCILILSILRLLFVPFFFIYTSADEDLIPRNDTLIISGVALFAFSSGFLVTAGYQLAPKLLSNRQQLRSNSKLAGLMNVCFSGSLLVGLLTSFALLGVGVS